jgi:hypothetical protein
MVGLARVRVQCWPKTSCQPTSLRRCPASTLRTTLAVDTIVERVSHTQNRTHTLPQKWQIGVVETVREIGDHVVLLADDASCQKHFLRTDTAPRFVTSLLTCNPGTIHQRSSVRPCITEPSPLLGSSPSLRRELPARDANSRSPRGRSRPRPISCARVHQSRHL